MLNHSAALDRTFQALADPTRRAIVERLSLGPASVSELTRPHGMSMPSAMQHIAQLEASGLVGSIKVGRVRTCHLRPDALSVLRVWLDQRRAEWESRFERLDEYLGEPGHKGETDE